jgi:hypothetical protein
MARRARTVLLLALSLSARIASAQVASAGRVFDDAWLRGVVERIRPVVERECERTFRTPPQIGTADVGDVARAMQADVAPGVEVFLRGQPRARIDRAIRLRAELFASGILGKYGFASKEVYVVPQVARSQLARVRRSDADVETVLQLVVAHELVHALQDQELDLMARLRAAGDNDRLEALAMLIEGHAVFCSERVAHALGLQDAIVPLRSVMVGHHDPAHEPAADLVTRRIRGAGILTYLHMAEFFAREHARGGHEGLWQLLAAPATTTRELILQQPTTACADASPAFAELDGTFAGRSWTIGRSVLADRLLLGENLPRAADLRTLLPKLRGSGEWFALSPSPSSWRAVYALRFEDAETASDFVALAIEVAQGDAGRAAAEIVSDIELGWDGVPATRFVQTPRTPIGDRGVLAFFRRGADVVQVTIANAPLPDEDLVAAVRSVFARLAD